ncbi:ABC transporter permease [Peloplasma aerotolerans]|uniref:ABC transporter permease subunit n=1 Tax=Peloplasma aerotolerans TaxID=3044389 RepID=A0AAW6UDJ2_9MOLU|nr:ABC transporter permease subunit [Mariniplasma sp. M4Ah]MDI6453058.1 ABC transporter permease subunit [Mariniplasma sp. M4Ah]
MSDKKHHLRKYNIHPMWLLSPVIILYAIFIFGGIVLTWIESLGHIPTLGLYYQGFAAYIQVFQMNDIWLSIVYSVGIALISTLISTFIGVKLAYGLANNTHKFSIIIQKNMLRLGLILPYLLILFMIIILASRTGFLSRLLFQSHFISSSQQFPQLVYDRLGIGIMLTFILKGIPFVGLFTYYTMSQITENFKDVAKTLGSNEKVIYRKLYIPLSANTIIWTSVIIFAYYLGSFEIPYLLGSVDLQTISSRVYSLYVQAGIDKIPVSMAMHMVLLVIGMISVGIYAYILKRYLVGYQS